MGKKQKKLSWADTEEVAFRLIDEYPNTDPRKLSSQDIFQLVTDLPDFSDKAKPNASKLEELAARWFAERSDMDDELGSLDEVSEADLDEDDYRDDRLAEDSDDEEESDTMSLDEMEEDEDSEEEEY